VFADDQSLVLWRNTSKNLDLIVEEVIGILFNEIVVNGIVVVYYLLILEIANLFGVLLNLAAFVTAKMNNLYRIIGLVVAFPLNNSDGSCFGNHSDHNSSLNAEENVVSSDYLGVDIAVGQS
jgi:hypothetical protein